MCHCASLKSALPSSIPRKRLLPIAVVPIVFSPTRRSLSCARGDSKLEDWKMVSPSGALSACLSPSALGPKAEPTQGIADSAVAAPGRFRPDVARHSDINFSRYDLGVIVTSHALAAMRWCDG